MSSGRAVVLLPPSKGKAAGGDGPAYGTVPGPPDLAEARAMVLEAAVAAAGSLDDRVLARLAGVPGRDVADARAELADLRHAPTLPAAQRYTGVVHGNAGLAGRDPANSGVEILVVSALLGFTALDEPVPPYRLELAASLPPLGGLATFWRDSLAGPLAERLDGRVVIDLLPAVHARAVAPTVREACRTIEVAFRDPEGRAANAARTKVAKGRLVAQLAAQPAGEVVSMSVADLAASLVPGGGWRLDPDGDARLVATFHG